ncbi:hypothetical protein [Paenibacillus sp. DCT19]|uniref:hypothetical protein n=1 Tax=Paenibacillus sp. DCT19 TaxID=2211212 RepID=UPI000FE1B9C2|nr:hypothetical protein [Paenibacillus sp. DCT19]
MVKKLKQILLIIVALLLITGCRDQQDGEEYVNTSSDSSTSFTQLDSESEIKAENLQELVAVGLEKRLNREENSENITIDVPYDEGSSIFATYYLNQEPVTEVGMIQAVKHENEYILQNIDLSPIDKQAPFWLAKFVGTTMDGKSNFRVNYGYINDPSINEIRIQYSNVTMHGMSMDDRKTFLDVTTDEKMIETSVQGIDGDNNLVYKYD